MKTSYIILAIGAVIILAGFALLRSDSQPTMIQDMIQKSNTPTTQPSQDDGMDSESSADSYLPYSPEAFKAAEGSRRVLFFFANWCPTCKPVDAELSAQKASLPDDLVVLRVNYNDSDTDDAEKALAKHYTVTYQHTFVQIDESGQEVARWNGGGLSELLESVK